MSRWVYKQNLYPGTSSFVTARRIVHVGVDPTGPQDGPTIWFESGTNDLRPIELRVYATGETIADDDMAHLGSVVTPVGLVWHVYTRSGGGL
jgi:hypothetical protein